MNYSFASMLDNGIIQLKYILDMILYLK